MRRTSLTRAVAAGFFLLSFSSVFAQSPGLLRSREAPSKSATGSKSATKATVIEFELLQSTDGGGLHAQQWLKVLEPLNVSLRVHRGSSNDQQGVTERETAGTRYVKAVGNLDSSGKIAFPNASFAPGDSAKLKEWIEELRTYGIQGSPAGQPLWGLTKAQFADLYAGLTKPIEFETENVSVTQVVAKVPLPEKYPIQWSPEAKELVARRGDRGRVRQELKQFSLATVLAISLGEQGLAFRPQRMPSGAIELLIEPRNPKVEQWPVGWPVKQQATKAAPKLNAMVPVELDDIELSDVINAISQLSETPILIDYAELDAKQIDLEKIKVSFPRKMTTWNLALRQLVAPQKLTRELWQDEAGRVFVWITTTRAGRARDTDK